MAPFSQFFKYGLHKKEKTAASATSTSTISTAYATETPRPTTPQLRPFAPLRRIPGDSSASDSENGTETFSSDSSWHCRRRVPRRRTSEDFWQAWLEERGNEIRPREAMVRAAKENEQNVKRMMQMLLRYASSQQKAAVVGKPVVEQKALVAALELFGTKTEALVVPGFWTKVAILVSELQKIVSRSKEALEIMEVLLRERSTASSSSPAIRITEGWVIAVAVNDTCGAELMSLLFREKRHGDDVRITERVLEEAARNKGVAKDIFELLFRERRDELQFTTRVLLAACSNDTCAGTIVELLLTANEGKKVRVTKSMVEATSKALWMQSEFPSVVRTLEEVIMMKQTIKKIISRSDNIHFTALALSALARLEDTSLLECLLSEVALVNRFKIHPGMVEAAAANSKSGIKVMELLFRERGNEVQITERVILAAVGNERLGLAIVKFLFRERAGDVRVMERTLEVAARKHDSRDSQDSSMLKLLLGYAGGGIRVTTKMVENAVLNVYGGDEALNILLQAGRHDIQITKELVAKAYDKFDPRGDKYRKHLKILLTEGHGLRVSEAALAFTNSDVPGIIAQFLQKNGDDENIREAVLIAAIKYPYKRIQLMLLTQSWESVKITKRIVLTVDRDNLNVEELERVLEQLLPKYGDAVEFSEEAIEAVMQRCGSNIVQLLLQKQGGKIWITSKIMESVAKNKGRGKNVLKLLLQQRGNEIHITEGVVEAAISNEVDGRSILLLLLIERGEEIQLTERLLEFAARKSQCLWKWILWESDRDIQVTERVVIAAASNELYGDEILQELLREYGNNIQITERVVEAAAGNPTKGIKILAFLLQERGGGIYITERIMEAAAQNTLGGIQILVLLFEERSDEAEITERVLEAAASNPMSGDQIMDYLLCKYGDDIEISERVLEAACRNARRGLQIVKSFLDKKGTNIQMTSKVLELAAGNGFLRRILLSWSAKMLLEEYSDEDQLMETVEKYTKASIRNERRLRLRDIRPDILLEESLINSIQLTERVIGLIARFWPFMLKKLLQEKGEGVQITARVLEESAACEDYYHVDGMERLLQATTGKIRVTTRIVEAAAANEQNGKQMIELLLEERGDEFNINEKIMREAAKNSRSGAQVITILLRERGQSGEIQVDERLLEVAAGNEQSGEEIIDLLLQESGDRIQLTDTIAEIAAENKGCGERIIELFRMRTQR